MSVQSYRDRLEPAACEMGVPGFEPHPLLKGAHVQTVVGRYIGGEQLKLAAAPHQVALPDGDRLLVLESIPKGWEPRMPAAVLVHGLAGCADANYMGRLSQRLIALDPRRADEPGGSGDGFGLARQIYHAGRSDDLLQVVRWLHGRIEGSPIALVGFSLGASLVLKAGIEAAEHPVEGLDCLLAANAPIDLIHCARQMPAREPRVQLELRAWLAQWSIAFIGTFPTWDRRGSRECDHSTSSTTGTLPHAAALLGRRLLYSVQRKGRARAHRTAGARRPRP